MEPSDIQKALVTVGLPKTLQFNHLWKETFTGAAIIWLRGKGYSTVAFIKYDNGFEVNTDSEAQWGIISGKSSISYEDALAQLVNLIKELK